MLIACQLACHGPSHTHGHGWSLATVSHRGCDVTLISGAILNQSLDTVWRVLSAWLEIQLYFARVSGLDDALQGSRLSANGRGRAEATARKRKWRREVESDEVQRWAPPRRIAGVIRGSKHRSVVASISRALSGRAQAVEPGSIGTFWPVGGVLGEHSKQASVQTHSGSG